MITQLKTGIIKHIADTRGARYVRLELASLEEIGDIVGIPCKEFIMNDLEGNEIWVTEKLVSEYINLGYKLCPHCQPRMGYAVPAWVPTNSEEEVLVVLDDYTRASGLFMQAIMGLVQFGEYISWKLPKKAHLLLTSNEDNGSMNVTSLDSAQSSRLINLKLDFDYEQYGRWMDSQHLKSEAINFMLLNNNIFDQSDRVNARTYTMFANAIAGINDLSNIDNLDTICLIAKGCFGNDTNIGNLFVTFVHNKLDKLMSAREILSGTWDDTSKKIKENVFKDGEYRADIASVLTMRLINYIEMLERPRPEQVDIVIKRIGEIVTHHEVLLTEDLIFTLIKKLNKKSAFVAKCSKLMMIPKVMAKISI